MDLYKDATKDPSSTTTQQKSKKTQQTGSVTNKTIFESLPDYFK